MDSILQNMDLEKKEKIINAAIEEFALYPYDKASTNNIVKKADISKGLLFHYFGNKRDLYEKLTEFVINKLFHEIVSQIDWEETDIFERIKALVIVKMKIGQSYPKMFDFIVKVLTDQKANSIDDVARFYEKHGISFQNLLNDVYTKNIDFSLFRDSETIDKSINIIRWTMEKYAIESLVEWDTEPVLDYEKISSDLDQYIHILKKAVY